MSRIQKEVTSPVDTNKSGLEDGLTSAEIGAIAHLYRGEVYRSTIWRTRLDNTTNWAVVTTGLAFSISFSRPDASPLPLILVGFLIIVFMLFEAHRYRYFNVWRARARHLETEFYAPMLRGEGIRKDTRWNEILADDYCNPHHHISYARAVGRRLRRNYGWVLGVQAIAYLGQLAIHPTPLKSMDELFQRATVGPLSGEVVLTIGLLFHLSWITFAIVTYKLDAARRIEQKSRVAMG